MITESVARARMPLSDCSASGRSSRCTPLAGCTLKLLAPASCCTSSAQMPVALITPGAVLDEFDHRRARHDLDAMACGAAHHGQGVARIVHQRVVILYAADHAL